VPDLTWSAEIEASAQTWANRCTLSHQANSGYGENLFWGTADAYSPQDAVAKWYGENAAYNFATPGFSTQTGHFTQVVWRNSTQLGCAKASCKGFDYWVRRYSPAGNVADQFPQNVPRPTCLASVPKPHPGFNPGLPKPPIAEPLPQGDARRLFKMKP
jgi:cysteine-rich secretory family protein